MAATAMHATRRSFLKQSILTAAAGIGPLRGVLSAEETRSLRVIAAEHGLLAGCAVAPEYLMGEAQYAEIVAQQANILVPENALKWHALRPTPDTWDYAPAEMILAFAEVHGQHMRGHNLCWHQALPDWFASAVTKENAQHVLTDHIRHVAGHFAGKLHSWDVVNEAIEPGEGRLDGLRKSPWLELIGPDYIEIAFRAARTADSSALLAYNEYGIELDTQEQATKRGHVLELVRGLKQRGAPIQAVGVQSHLTAGDPPPGAGLIQFVRELHAMRLQVFITELDVADHKIQGTVAERDAAVAKVYGEYLRLMLAEPNVTAVLTWGVTDKYTYVNHKGPRSDGQMQRPLPFDPDYKPTAAFYAMQQAIANRKIIAG